MEFKFADSARLKIKPQVVGERLTELIQSNGGVLTPDLVVEDAKPEDSPLHPAFEWDDIRAAKLHRLDQARYMIRIVEVVQVNDNPNVPSVAVRAFIRTESMESGTYRTVASLMSNSALRVEYLSRLRKEAAECRTRLSKFEEFGAVVIAIDSVLAKVA